VAAVACSPDKVLAPYGVRVVDASNDSATMTADDRFRWRISPDSAWGSHLDGCESFPLSFPGWMAVEDSIPGVRLKLPAGLKVIPEKNSRERRTELWGDVERGAFVRVGRLPEGTWGVLDTRNGGRLRFTSKCLAHVGPWIIQVDRVTVTGGGGRFTRDTMHLAELHIAPNLPFMFQAGVAAASPALRDSMIGSILQMQAIDTVVPSNGSFVQDSLRAWLRHLERQKRQRRPERTPGRLAPHDVSP
jgi:hypothetical protein